MERITSKALSEYGELDLIRQIQLSYSFGLTGSEYLSNIWISEYSAAAKYSAAAEYSAASKYSVAAEYSVAAKYLVAAEYLVAA